MFHFKTSRTPGLFGEGLDKEILEKNAWNKIRVHQCLPIVEKNIGEAKVGLTKHHSRVPPFFEKLR